MKKCTLLLIALGFFSMAQSQFWNLTGNAGTNSKINFLGTTDDNPLLIRIRNQFSGEIDSVYAQTFFGYGAGRHMTNGTNNVGIGYRALSANTGGGWNTACGASALAANTTGYENAGTGYYALTANTTGIYNTANGAISLYSNTTGSQNAAFGFGALSANVAGYGNTASGFEALYYSGVYGDATNYNTANGALALFYNFTGIDNTASGYQSLYINQTGIWNTASGVGSLFHNLGGNYNTAVGGYSLYATTNSWYNTVVGYNAAHSYDMGYNNTILGANCDVSGAGYYNCIAIGQAVICTASSQARFGNAATNSIGGYANWTNISDGRYKKDVTEDVKGLDFIMKLRPITYHLDVSGISKKLNEDRGKETDPYMMKAIAEKEKILFSGFVAQEVEEAAKETGYDFSGVDKPQNETGLYGLRYAEFVVPLVKSVQELSVQNTALKDQNTELKKQVEDLQERMKRLESSFVTKK